MSSSVPTHKSAHAKGELFAMIASMRGLTDLDLEKKTAVSFPSISTAKTSIQVPLDVPKKVANSVQIRK